MVVGAVATAAVAATTAVAAVAVAAVAAAAVAAAAVAVAAVAAAAVVLGLLLSLGLRSLLCRCFFGAKSSLSLRRAQAGAAFIQLDSS